MKIWSLILWIVMGVMACDRQKAEEPLENTNNMGSVQQSTGTNGDFKIPLVPGLDWEITQSWADHCEECDIKYPNDPTSYCNDSHVTCASCQHGWDFNLDNNADKDKEVLASGKGTVKTVAKDSGWGNYVVIDHGGNICSRYAHMADNTVTVQEGQQACQGLVLGQIGTTGNSDSEHLHYQFEDCNTRESLDMGFTDGNGKPICAKGDHVYTNGTYTALLLTNVVRHSCDGSPPVGDAVLSVGMIEAACGSLQGCPLAPDCGRSASSHEFVDNDSLDARVKKAADYLYSECAVDGKSDGALHPNDTINRAEALKIPLELFGLVNDDCQNDSVPFTDVPDDAWYYGVVACGISNDVINTLRPRFKPGYKVNFAEAAKMAVEAGVKSHKITYRVSTEQHFSQIPENHWAYKYVETIYAYGGAIDRNASPTSWVKRGDYMIMLASLSPCFCGKIQCDEGCSCDQDQFACIDPNDNSEGTGGGNSSNGSDQGFDLEMSCWTTANFSECEGDEYVFMTRCSLENNGDETLRLNNFYASISDPDDAQDCEVVLASTKSGGVGYQTLEAGETDDLQGGFKLSCEREPADGEVSVDFDVVDRQGGVNTTYPRLLSTTVAIDANLVNSCAEPVPVAPPPPPATPPAPMAHKNPDGTCSFTGTYSLWVSSQGATMEVLTGNGQYLSQVIPENTWTMLQMECGELPVAIFIHGVGNHSWVSTDPGSEGAAQPQEVNFWAPYNGRINTHPLIAPTGHVSHGSFGADASRSLLIGVGF